MNQTAKQRLAGVPRQYRKLYLRVVEGQASPREAIKAKCYECLCWEGDGKGHSLQQMIDACASKGCPLWHFRPQRPEVPATAGSEASEASAVAA